MIEFDAGEFRDLADDLGRSGDEVGRQVDRILRVGATKVKNALRDEAQGVAHAPAFPWSITYESHEVEAQT